MPFDNDAVTAWLQTYGAQTGAPRTTTGPMTRATRMTGNPTTRDTRMTTGNPTTRDTDVTTRDTRDTRATTSDDDGDEMITCPLCNGEKDCPTCHGVGDCPQCHGTGEIPKSAVHSPANDEELVAEAAEELREHGVSPETLDLLADYDPEHNPASWVEDEATWERAKKAVDPEGKGSEYDNPYAVVVDVYRKMGGKIRGKQ